MQVTFSRALSNDRVQVALGKIKATTSWRRAAEPVGDLEREIAVRALIREAEEFGADAVVGVEFTVETVGNADIGGLPLSRVTVTGEAVRFNIAA